MAAVPGTRPFGGHRDLQLSTGGKECRGVFRPARAVEVQGEEPAGFVGQQRVDPDHELPTVLFVTLSAQMITNDGRSERQELTVWATPAFVAALVAVSAAM